MKSPSIIHSLNKIINKATFSSHISKKISPLLMLLFSLFLISCEEVVDVDLDTAPPRLVIEASIKWEKSTSGNVQQIHLTTTAPYYADEVPPVHNATVYITDEEGNQFDFIEEDNTGFYTTDSFIPVMSTTYNLTVVHDGETYMAKETLLPVSDLTYVTQNSGDVFSEEYIEIKAYFNDPADEENYYMYTFDAEKDNTIDVIEDRLVNGNEVFAFFVSEDIQSGEDVDISLSGISKQYYNYMYTLLAQANEGGGPFETQPATVRGNIINTTNPDNFAFGYFRLSETDKYTYTIE
ncbi:DUF4249 domain-containing protein [Galbibacter pacificus]|uniref:DUF4249 domain-containing protein n=1 Tax=Galbibacter pacificus TaxID=2996052 RepID=A0ABT6FPE8_9FLAO|nr:DUF4249 domain-containing protein [Galbibacter pacificus]MDG3582388.1 DUF4249 domain-containing protein [Galbibacter pacificus]MDG3585136.1 DUF4249 domain-containing protein [Galbibacter pacificus]